MYVCAEVGVSGEARSDADAGGWPFERGESGSECLCAAAA